MKFFKFNLSGYNDGRYYFETHYLNVETIKDIIVSSSIGNNEFIIRTVGGSVFRIQKDFLDSLIKLLNLDEKERKNED